MKEVFSCIPFIYFGCKIQTRKPSLFIITWMSVEIFPINATWLNLEIIICFFSLAHQDESENAATHDAQMVVLEGHWEHQRARKLHQTAQYQRDRAAVRCVSPGDVVRAHTPDQAVRGRLARRQLVIRRQWHAC